MKYAKNLVLLLCLEVLFSAPILAADHLITSYGAVANDAACDTSELQAAIDEASNAGGGRVVIPSGKFIVASVAMKSNVTIELNVDAVLESTSNAALLGDPFDWNSAMFRGSRLANVGFTGSGKIDGVNLTSDQGEGGTRGPHLISLQDCTDLTFSGISLERAGNYSLHLNGCKDVTISGIHITGGYDGLHVRGGENFVVSDLEILNNTDDGIAGHSNMNFRFENISINGGRANGFRWGCDRCTARRITVKDKEGYALIHFSPSDAGSWVGHSLESNNWIMEDWKIENSGGFLYYSFGESWQDARPMGSAVFNRIYGTELRNATIAVGDSGNRVVDLCFRNCYLSSTGKTNAGFTWPPYGIYVANAKRAQITDSKFWFTNSEDRGVVTILDSTNGIVKNVGYKTNTSPFSFINVTTSEQSGNYIITEAPAQIAIPGSQPN
jgi:hypothetical protein